MEFRINKAAGIAMALRAATGGTWFIEARAAAYSHRSKNHVDVEFSLSVVFNKGGGVAETFKSFHELSDRAKEICIKHRRF